MSVTVTLSGASPESVDGADFDIEAGHLIVVDGNGDNVAAFAPGSWQSAVVVPS